MFLSPILTLCFAFVLGMIIGSFLDVVVCRFNTGASLNGRSRCFSCGKTLRWYELIPGLSFVVLQGRCQKCRGAIPLRLPLMEIITGVAFVYIIWNAPTIYSILFGWVLVSVLIVVAAYDIRHMVIPNLFAGLLCLLAVVYFIGASLMYGHTLSFFSFIFGGVVVSTFFWLLWFVSEGKWIGFGDVKLGFPLGCMVGLGSAFSFVVFSFWIGAVVSVLIVALQYLLQRGKHVLPFRMVPLTIKSEVPFAPFIIAAFVVVYISHWSVFTILINFV